MHIVNSMDRLKDGLAEGKNRYGSVENEKLEKKKPVKSCAEGKHSFGVSETTGYPKQCTKCDAFQEF